MRLGLLLALIKVILGLVRHDRLRLNRRGPGSLDFLRLLREVGLSSTDERLVAGFQHSHLLHGDT